MKETITSDDVLGKVALDPDGSILGTTTKIHIDTKKKKILGITVDMGLLKPDLYIGIDKIKFFGVDAVLLKSIPADKYNGLVVRDSEGKPIGVVKEVIRNDKEIIEINIKPVNKSYPSTIPSKDIDEIGDSVMLKMDADSLKI